MKKYIYTTLRILLGLLFLFSAYSKLNPIENFEMHIIESGLLPFWILAPIIARILIGLEFALGVFLIFGIYLKKFTFKITAALLILFTFYLAWLLITVGNNVDCGCFGKSLQLGPKASIIKNIVCLFIVFLLFFKNQGKLFLTKFRNKWLTSGIFILFIALPFAVNPMPYLSNPQTKNIGEGIDLSQLPSLHQSNQEIDFTKGKKLVCFFSLTCPFCEQAALRLSALNKQSEMPDTYMVLWGDSSKLKPFFDKTKSEVFPYIYYPGDSAKTFLSYSGGVLPSIILLDSGKLVRKWTGKNFNYVQIQKIPDL